MAKYRKKPIVVEAVQWFKPGDHPLVVEDKYAHCVNVCRVCSRPESHHGWIRTLEGGHVVCPGDWIITGIKGEVYPCKPDIFEQTYEAVKEGE